MIVDEIDETADENRENFQNFLKLLKENPDLPVVPMVDIKSIISDDDFQMNAFEMFNISKYLIPAKIGYSYIGEYLKSAKTGEMIKAIIVYIVPD